MEQYAIIRTGGKQYKVGTGSRIEIERLIGEIGSKVEFTEVLMLKNGEQCQVGSPLLTSAKVSARIVSHLRGPKVVSFKKRRRKGYTKKIGHRQEITAVVIEAIA